MVARETGLETMAKFEFAEALASLDREGTDDINLKDIVDLWKDRAGRQDVLTVGIYWIGHQLTTSNSEELIVKNNLLVPAKGADGSEFYP